MLGLGQVDASLLGQIMAGDDGMHNFFGHTIADGDTNEMPLVVRKGQGCQQYFFEADTASFSPQPPKTGTNSPCPTAAFCSMWHLGFRLIVRPSLTLLLPF